MISRTDLTGLLDSNQFTRIESAFRKRFQFGLEVADRDGVRLEGLCSEDSVPEFCTIACGNDEGQNRCRADRLDRIRRAMDTGEPDVMSCHAGIMIGCVPLMDRERPLGGVFFGKCLAEPVPEAAEEEIVSRGAERGVDEELLSAAVATLRRVGNGKLQAAGDLLCDLLYDVAGLDAAVIRWRRERSRGRRRIQRIIEERRDDGVTPKYPLVSEQELTGKLKLADKVGAKEILDALLAAVLMRRAANLKTRTVELLALLSRSAMEGGADIEVMLHKNAGYVEKVLGAAERWDICAWLSRALDDYIDVVSSSQDASSMAQVRPAVAYVEANYGEAVTLADVAKVAHLSVSRLAHVFKEQVGATVIEYLTRVRIEHAKELLLKGEHSCAEVCFAVGYNNQSYFTRTFKDLVGVTPSRFRSKNRRRK